MKKKLFTFILIFALVTLLSVSSAAEGVNVAVEAAAVKGYYLSADAVTDGKMLNEYLALICSGFTVVDDAYIPAADGSVLSFAKTAIINMASGKPADGENIEALKSAQGDNGLFGTFDETYYAFIALRASKTVFSSESAVNGLVLSQKEDGSFGSGIVETARTLTLLAPYTADANVLDSAKKALKYLQSVQNDDGTFGDGSTETLCEVIMGICDVGENAGSEAWKNLLGVLIERKNTDASYRPTLADGASTPSATAYALCALHTLSAEASPLKRLMNDGKLTSYNLADIYPFLIAYGVLALCSVGFWIFIFKRKNETKTLEESKELI